MGQNEQVADAGALVSCGPDAIAIARRTPAHIDKILKGASPRDLPVEQPIKFGLVINLKTAKSLGLEIPPSLLARASKVIEYVKVAGVRRRPSAASAHGSNWHTA